MNAALESALDRSNGWQARLDLRFEARAQQGKTVLAAVRHQGPLRIQRPFHPEGDICHVYVLHPPGGVVGGDGLNIDARCEEGGQALVTTPGATKFYRSAGDTALVRQKLTVAPGASLEWLPQENIFFPGARVNLQTEIDLAADAHLVMWEINCLGRPVIGERFDEGALRSRLRVRVDGQPMLIEHQRTDCLRHLNATAGLRGAPMQGVLLAWQVDDALAQSVQESLQQYTSDSLLAGATLLDGLLVVRVLGDHAERMRDVLAGVWQRLRPKMIARPAVMPRIWAT